MLRSAMVKSESGHVDVRMTPSDKGFLSRHLDNGTKLTALYETNGYWYIAYKEDFGYIRSDQIEIGGEV